MKKISSPDRVIRNSGVLPEPPEAARKIVLLWIGRLGDLLVTTPLLGALRARFPHARIALVVRENAHDAAALLPDINEIWTLGSACNLAAHGRLLQRLRAEPADLLIDLNSACSKTSALLARLARARVKLAFDTGRGARIHTHLLPAAGEREPMAERYARLARALGAEIKDPALRVKVRGGDLERARVLLQRFAASTEGTIAAPPHPASGIDRRPAETDASSSRERWIAVHPGNFKKFDNRWPEANFVELTNRLAAWAELSRGPGFSGWRIVYLSGPGEERQVREIVSKLKHPVPILLPQPTGVTAAFLSLMDLFVGNCTGTTHLAIAAGTPTFTILSGYTKTVWMPGEGSSPIARSSPNYPRRGPSDGGSSPRHRHVASESWTSCRDVPLEAAWERLQEALEALPARKN